MKLEDLEIYQIAMEIGVDVSQTQDNKPLPNLYKSRLNQFPGK